MTRPDTPNAQNPSARAGAVSEHAEEERELVAGAAIRSASADAELAQRGFGDHKGRRLEGEDGGLATPGPHHPLPASEKARHDEVPESLERAKGHGDDAG